MPENIIDLDALLADDIKAAIAETTYVKVSLFKRDWRVSSNPNVYTALGAGAGDTSALAKMLANLIHPDERDDFRNALMDADGINATVLMKILNSLVEAAAARPTKSSSGSSAGSTPTRVRKPKSAAT